MASIVGRQVDAVGLVVGGDQKAENVEDVVFSQMFLIDAQHIGRRGGVDFGVVIEGEAIDRSASPRSRASFTRRITDLRKAIEPPEQMGRGDVVEIPRSDRLFHRLQQTCLCRCLAAA